jgi:hypothetical protein
VKCVIAAVTLACSVLLSGASVPKQNLALEIFYGGAWHDLVTDDDVFADAPVKIRRGLGDESAGWPRPAQITAKLNNATDKYRTSNPESDLYGLAGRNTPLRVSVDGTVRGVVEASSWSADQTRDFRQTPRCGRAWVDVAGGGLLQRIGQWTAKLGSPFRRFNERIADLAGYWPMEDGAGTIQPFSTVPEATTTRFRGVSFESQERAPGSGPVANVITQFGATFKFTGGVPDATNGWQLGLVTYMADPGNVVIFTLLSASTLNGGRFFAFFDNATEDLTLQVVQGGVAVINFVVPMPGFDWYGKWFSLLFDVSYSAGTTTVAFKWRAIDDDGYSSIQDSYSGIPSNLNETFVTNGGGIPNGSAFGHVIGVHGQTDDLGSDARFEAFLGYPGERAAYRFGRLIDEELGPGHYYVSGSFNDSMPMGPQADDSLPNHIKEMIATEDALVYDHGTELKLFFVCRVDRYDQTVALALTPTDLPALPREVNDDKIAGNVVTASQRNGGDATARDDTSPLGTQAPPDGVGEEKRTVDVNLDDPSLLPQVANWWLRRGTVDLPRFPQLMVDLGAAPHLIDAVEATTIGSVITISGFREYLIRLYVLGWTETIGTHSRRIIFTCAPDQQFVTGEWDSAESLWDSMTTTLKTAAGKTDTSLTFRTVSSKGVWSTTATPYPALISGELVTVTSMGAASLVSGAYDQAATVRRSVNGIRKALAAGESIAVATPGRWAL